MMKQFKGFICGLLVGTIGITTVFAANGIKSATFNANKVIFNGKTLDLSSNPMISVVKDGESNASNYMPVRAVLEGMGYTIDWDGSRNAVIINSSKSEMVYYSNHPTLPDFAWVVREHANIPDLVTTTGADRFNPEIRNQFIRDTDGVLGKDTYLISLSNLNKTECERLVDLYIQALISEGFVETSSELLPGGVMKNFVKDGLTFNFIGGVVDSGIAQFNITFIPTPPFQYRY